MTATPGEVLRTVFGYSEFRSNQRDVIETVLRGDDAFVLMPSGGGKSLCYQIPALLRLGAGIVVSPLISLMKDQVDALRANGVRAAAYNSSLEATGARRVLADLRGGRLDLLYVSPERVTSDGFLDRLGALGATGVALIAVDEAHCISQWGHDFRPEYVELRRLRERLPGVPLVALTATADPHTRDDIRHQLGLERSACFVSSFDRPNIRLEVVDKHNPHAQLQRFLARYGHLVKPGPGVPLGHLVKPGPGGAPEGEAGIIYCSTRRRTDDLAAYLRGRGMAAGAYHAGLSAEERDEVQEAFIFDRIKIVVATVAFGMGIDKTNVRFVVHWDLPQHLEGYYQEIGRAGRDGLPASALMLFGWEDVARVRALIEKGGNEQRVAVEQHKLGALVGFAQELTCRRRALLGYLGETMEAGNGHPGCGNCDVCLDPPEFYDATEEARKALSCVYRTGERFGVGHVVDVLRGSQNQRIVALGHERLSTYGIGADRSAEAWRSLLRQLVHLGYLRQGMGEYPVLELTPAAAPLLRGEVELRLARPRVRSAAETEAAVAAKEAKAGERGAKRRRGGAGTGDGMVLGPAVERDAAGQARDNALFEELRALRRRIAEREGVPAYVIFHDATLREMASSRPATPGELLGVNGVGERKLDKYGEEFLALLRRDALR
ncbi:MAG: RecQ family ATP-dependent DNA helicase [Thermoleophilia bacterium]|nr:RecQ family ATP-dependent DNA helicase [Thermoleophilia bacterium]